MRLLVTGGSGFVGSHFINAAQKQGHEVVALKRIGSQSRVKLDKQPKWIEGQLDDLSVADMSGFDILIHLAAAGVSPQPATWEDCYFWNVQQTMILLEKAITAGIDKVVVAGTYAEYGDAGLRYDFIPPDAPLEPSGAYATSKAAACIAAKGICKEKKIKLTYLRIFSAFGEGQFEDNLWPSLMKKALAGDNFEMTSGEQIRDFIAVEDVAKRFVDELDFKGVVAGQPHVKNIGSGCPQTLLSFVQYWWKEWNASGQLMPGALPYRDNEVMRFVPQVS
jgi:UDP-glucose 4-epimerase